MVEDNNRLLLLKNLKREQQLLQDERKEAINAQKSRAISQTPNELIKNIQDSLRQTKTNEFTDNNNNSFLKNTYIQSVDLTQKKTTHFESDLHRRSHTSQNNHDYKSQSSRKRVKSNLKQHVVNHEGHSKEVMEHYLQTQAQRLEHLRTNIAQGFEENQDKQTKPLWNEVKVDQEIMLLRKARQMTKQSYQNRIRTGGSLVHQQLKMPDNKQECNNNPLVGDYSIASLVIEDQMLSKHFKHLPKLTKKVTQSLRTSKERPIVNNTQREQPYIKQSMIQSSIQSKQIVENENDKQIKKKEYMRLEILRLNKDEQVILKREDLKTMITALPIVLAEKPYDQQSEDFLYFTGCNFLHKHEYQAASTLFKDASITSRRMNQQFLFNQAYALFKLNGDDQNAIDIWSHDITDHEHPFFKTLSEFNVATMLYYYNLSHLENPGLMHFDCVLECARHFDYTMHKVMKMAHSQNNVKNKKSLIPPSWFNLEQLIFNCKKLYTRFKHTFEQIPHFHPTVDTSEFGGEVEDRDKAIYRKWILRQLLHYGAFFKSYHAMKEQQSKTTARSDYDQINKAKTATASCSTTARPATQMYEQSHMNSAFGKYHNKLLQGAPTEVTQSDLMDTFEDGAPSEMHEKGAQRIPNIQTPQLILSHDFDKFEFVPSLRFSKLFTEGHNSEAELLMPFVSSKRPEIIIKGRKKLKIPKIEIFKEEFAQDNEDTPTIHHVHPTNYHQIDLQQEKINSSPGKTPIISQEFPIQAGTNNLPTIMEDNTIQESRNHQQETEENEEQTIQIQPRKVFRGERARSLVSQTPLKHFAEEYYAKEITGINRLPTKYFQKESDGNHIIQILDRPPQTSNQFNYYVKHQEYKKRKQHSMFNPFPNNTTKHIQIEEPSLFQNNNLLSPKRMHDKNMLQEPVEIDRDFLGALITKEGKLYDDEQHDQTYKKKLRLREVHEIQKYLQNKDNKIEQTHEEIDKYLNKLWFFNRYPESIRQQLLSSCTSQQLKVYQAGEIIFEQGDDSPEFYVILRGSAKAILIKKEYGYIPFVISTFYDGKDFGEVTLYQVSENLTPAMVSDLNKQKYTCEAMETTYVLSLDKALTATVINRGCMQATFEERIAFLSQIDIFKGIDMHVLLPLANNLEVKKFKLGEYILKEGRAPKGLFIVTKGQLRVGSEQINMRSKDVFPMGRLKQKLKNFRIKGNFHDMEDKINIFEDDQFAIHKEEDRLETKESDREGNETHSVALEVQRIFNDKRIFQNDRILYDEQGRKIKNHIVYKDFMTFFTLSVRDYFGGRVLLLKNQQQPNGDKEKEASPAQRRNENLEDFGTLSVIADSSEVELLMMDRSQMSFFPEDLQKEIYARIEKAFQPECPYAPKIIERVKDKFNEWQRYKLQTVGTIVRQGYAQRRKHKVLCLDR